MTKTKPVASLKLSFRNTGTPDVGDHIVVLPAGLRTEDEYALAFWNGAGWIGLKVAPVAWARLRMVHLPRAKATR